MKGKGRKRLYMDPREDGDGAMQAVHESAEDDPSTAFSLPKRQRVNTWGTDSKVRFLIFTANDPANLIPICRRLAGEERNEQRMMVKMDLRT